MGPDIFDIETDVFRAYPQKYLELNNFCVSLLHINKGTQTPIHIKTHRQV